MNKTHEEQKKYIEFLCSPEAEGMPDGTRLTNLIVAINAYLPLLSTEHTAQVEEAVKSIVTPLHLALLMEAIMTGQGRSANDIVAWKKELQALSPTSEDKKNGV